MATEPEVVADGKTSFRFGLKALLLLTTDACLVFAPVAWFGGFYLASALMSVVLVAACACAYASGRTGLMLAIAAASVVVGFMSLLVTFVLHALLNGIACIVGASLRVRPFTMGLLLCGTGVAIYARVLLNGASGIRELVVLKERHPLESISYRLAFERNEHPIGTNYDSYAPAQLSPTVVKNLAA